MNVPIAQNILAQYSTTVMNGEEDVDFIKNHREAAKKYVNDVQAKPNENRSWKILLGPWFVTNSKAHTYLLRPDVNDIDHFFNELIRRQMKEATDYDPSMRDYAVELTQAKSMDAHYRDGYEFHTKFVDEKISLTLATKLEEILSFGDSLNHEWFNKTAGTAVKNQLIQSQREKNTQILQAVKDIFVEQSLRRDLQGLVASDPELFKKLKTGQNTHSIS